MAAKPVFGTVVHLTATGHVLAVVTCGTLEPAVEQLTGDDHIRVRLADVDLHVDVPSDLLTATRVAVTPDVLDRPQAYVLGEGAAPLTLAPTSGTGGGAAAAGKKFVIVWQGEERAFPEAGVLDGLGTLPTQSPPGTIAALTAVEGGPLSLTEMVS